MQLTDQNIMIIVVHLYARGFVELGLEIPWGWSLQTLPGGSLLHCLTVLVV